LFLELRKRVEDPAYAGLAVRRRFVGIGGAVADGKVLLDVVVIEHRETKILQVVYTTCSAGGLTGRLDGGQKKSYQNPNDCDDDQQFDKRKGATS
jgi:hypothetical protein